MSPGCLMQASCGAVAFVTLSVSWQFVRKFLTLRHLSARVDTLKALILLDDD